MRVTLVGGPGVGKTTLAKLLADRLALPLLPEQSRPIAREWGLTPATIPDHRFMEFQWEILSRQILNEEIHHDGGYIADRCVIDTVAHLLALGKGLEISPSEHRRHFREASRRLHHYDLVVFIPPMFPMVADGERITDTGFQTELSTVIAELIDTLDEDFAPGLKGRTHVLKSLSIEDRVRELLHLMDHHPRARHWREPAGLAV